MSAVELAVAELERYAGQKTLEFTRSMPREYGIMLNQNHVTPDFRVIIGDDCIADNIKAAIREVKSPAGARNYFEKFDEMAQDYGKSERKKECYVCTEVRNILAKAIGEKVLLSDDYYLPSYTLEYKDDKGDR